MHFLTSPAYLNARAAILSTTSTTPAQLPSPRPELATERTLSAARPKVTPTPAPIPTADAIAAGHDLSPGAATVWATLHRLAAHVHRERATDKLPDALTVFCPAVIVAALSGYSERHTYRLLAELNKAGLIHSDGYVQKVGLMRRYSGTLFSVAMRPDARPRLRFWDYQAAWRADFEADYYGENGAWRQVQGVMSEPHALEDDKAQLWTLAQNYAVPKNTAKMPASVGSDTRPAATFGSLADALPDFLTMHPKQRHRAVSEWAASMSALLGEPHRLKQWCSVIYRAIEGEYQQRNTIAATMHAIRRFAAELRQGEGETLRRPGAALFARLKTA